VVTNREAPLARSPWTWVALAALVAFGLLALVVNGQGAAAFDDPVIAAVQGLGVPSDLWKLATEAGGDLLVPIRVGLVLLLVVQHRPRTALVYGIALLAAELWTHMVKATLARPRPPGAELLAGGFSFPSGHALNSTVTYGLIALLAWRSGLPARARCVVMAALVALIILVGLSRVGLGVHYPSDVLGGWLAGLVIVAVVALLTDPDPDAHQS